MIEPGQPSTAITERDFEGRVAVVTGGCAGIGRATARRIATSGGSVLICDLDRAAAETVAAEIRPRGASVLGIGADVASEADMRRLIRHCVDRFGGIDILVNNAGMQMFGTVVDTAETDWDRTLAVNLKGAYLAAKFAIPEMRKRGGGSIVNVASIHAFATIGNRVAYAASKTGLLGLTRAMALDHAGDGIRVNVVCPGATDTPMLRASWARVDPSRPVKDALADLADRHPLGRVGTAEEVAEVIAFLAGPRSGFVTGAEIKVDGGVLARFSIAPS